MTRRHLLLPKAFAVSVLLLGPLIFLLAGCCLRPRPRTFVPRQGDEIVVAGQLFHTGARVVTWMDPDGYDGYRIERRFSPLAESDWDHSKAAVKELRTPNRYGLRAATLSPAETERLRGGGWDLPTLRRVVDQLVLHYDACGVSKVCFETLHDRRGLSIHFMVDLDGTIYQTLDVKERAWHATISNSRSIGIEIANIGAFPPANRKAFDEWYAAGAHGRPVITVPPRVGEPMIRTKNFTGRPARPGLVSGRVQDTDLVQYDFTPEQYAALAKLTAALCTVFPEIRCDYPRDSSGKLVTAKLADPELARYHGVLGHFHLQANKTDPGPALQWDKLIAEARALMQ